MIIKEQSCISFLIKSRKITLRKKEREALDAYVKRMIYLINYKS